MPTSDASSVVALAQFEEQRPRLFAIAYRMLGSAADADDVLQDCFLRWRDARDVRSVPAFLTTVVTRLCLDRLKSAQTRRETYIGPWLPEPILTQPDEAPERAEMNESITVAFLALLERLNPVERAVFLLREVFDYDYAEIALFVDKNETACRQIFSRAQKYVRENRPRLPPNAAAHQRVLGVFLNALASGDLDGLTQILHQSVVSYGDGGNKAFAAKAPIHGRAAVAKFMVGLRRTAPAGLIPSIEHVNGQLALVLRLNGSVFSVLVIETDGEYIYGLRSIVNPDKLGRL
jgi:RNA polymerase sigma-70 factor, ECF subfamily